MSLSERAPTCDGRLSLARIQVQRRILDHRVQRQDGSRPIGEVARQLIDPRAAGDLERGIQHEIRIGPAVQVDDARRLCPWPSRALRWRGYWLRLQAKPLTPAQAQG